MAAYQIVKLAPKDWQRYRQIRLESLLVEPQAFSSSYENVVQRPASHWQQRLQEAQEGKRSCLLFARETDRIIGIIGAYRGDDSDAVEIISVYVAQDRRGQGVAAALMQAMLEEVSRCGAFRKAVLTVNTGQAAAVALYQKYGFQIVGETRGMMGDGITYSGYIMEKELG